MAGKKLKTKKQTTPIDWTKTRTYAGLALLATFITASAAGFTALSRLLGPDPPSAPVEKALSPAKDDALQQRVCKKWSSLTSKKRYDFVCNGPDSLDVYEITSQEKRKVGFGKLTADKRVEVELMVQPNNKRAPLRRARLSLTPSPDGKRLEGSFSGDDPREVGQLIFNAVQ